MLSGTCFFPPYDVHLTSRLYVLASFNLIVLDLVVLVTRSILPIYLAVYEAGITAFIHEKGRLVKSGMLTLQHAVIHRYLRLMGRLGFPVRHCESAAPELLLRQLRTTSCSRQSDKDEEWQVGRKAWKDGRDKGRVSPWEADTTGKTSAVVTQLPLEDKA